MTNWACSSTPYLARQGSTEGRQETNLKQLYVEIGIFPIDTLLTSPTARGRALAQSQKPLAGTLSPLYLCHYVHKGT